MYIDYDFDSSTFLPPISPLYVERLSKQTKSQRLFNSSAEAISIEKFNKNSFTEINNSLIYQYKIYIYFFHFFYEIILAFFFPKHRSEEKLNWKRFMKLKHANYFIISFYHFFIASASLLQPEPRRGIEVIIHFKRCSLTFALHFCCMALSKSDVRR